jgi:hypothetical protein
MCEIVCPVTLIAQDITTLGKGYIPALIPNIRLVQKCFKVKNAPAYCITVVFPVLQGMPQMKFKNDIKAIKDFPWCHDIQQRDTQYNDTKHNYKNMSQKFDKTNRIQHKDTQNNYKNVK